MLDCRLNGLWLMFDRLDGGADDDIGVGRILSQSGSKLVEEDRVCNRNSDCSTDEL